MSDSWHSYPSIFAVGHRAVHEMLLDPVQVEEKVDGSQFSFGLIWNESLKDYELRCRSKGAQLNTLAPEKMFIQAVGAVKEIQWKLVAGWTYRAEYLAKPKHNALAYDRIPKNHLMIFDVNTDHEQYLGYGAKAAEADRLGLECVPLIYQGMITTAEQFRSMLDRTSVLGGQKIEGVVVKNYNRFGLDKKALMAKFVSEAFKEVHGGEWRADNPTKADILDSLIEHLRTPARWNKAIQHLREAGVLIDAPQDIGHLIKETQADIKKECLDLIQQKLLEWALPHVLRGVVRGLPEWYKEELLKLQFSVESPPESGGQADSSAAEDDQSLSSSHPVVAYSLQRAEASC